MTLQEIINLIDINVPNSISTSIKIGFVNRIIEEYYRDYPTPDAIYPFITVAATEFVELPSNCPEDRVTTIVIDEVTYVYRDQKQPKFNYSWSIMAEQVFLVPTPDEALDGYIYYRPRPEGLSEIDLATVPGFAYDYQEMLVFGGSKRTAMTLKEPDYQKAAYYGNEFDKIAEKADRKLRKPSQKRVAVYRSWR